MIYHITLREKTAITADQMLRLMRYLIINDRGAHSYAQRAQVNAALTEGAAREGYLPDGGYVTLKSVFDAPGNPMLLFRHGETATAFELVDESIRRRGLAFDFPNEAAFEFRDDRTIIHNLSEEDECLIRLADTTGVIGVFD